ncbi:MAG: dihydroxy-acid dehydratase [Planctomycetaceae bacterium]|nr:dihydroxy-acid dehydratase [Planctomycetaceae bacterium]
MTELNWNSKNLTHGWQRGVTAFYYGLGFTPEDFDRAQVGIGVPLLEGNLCNMHSYGLGQEIAAGCRDAGLIGFPFGTPGVSDNITQGQEGGNGSLPSRNLIANCAELVVGAHGYDAMVGLHCCDKNGPGFAMALARLNFPGLIVSGGSIAPGCHKGQDISILDVYDSQAAAAVGAMSNDEAEEILRTACPGAGGCGIAASFNTWGIACEALGIMLPFSSSIPAVGEDKLKECRQVGQALRLLLEKNLRPRDILTRDAFANATAVIAAAGGSTNGILHLLALAREAEVDFGLRDMQPILRKTPVYCSFAPRGKKTMYDLHHIGGTPLLLKHLLKAGILNGECMTVTGKTHAENLADIPDAPTDGPDDLIAPLDAPFKPHADMQICFGNLAPDGVVYKVSSMKDSTFRGTAICFDDVRSVVKAVEEKRIKPGHIIILRNLGPVASGMPEVLVATAALATPELDGKVAFLSDTRVSGVSHGAIGVHCAPEAVVGGPIAFVEDGDEISFDLLAGDLTLHVDDSTLGDRRVRWQPPVFNRRRGYLADFSATVTQANDGCVSGASGG